MFRRRRRKARVQWLKNNPDLSGLAADRVAALDDVSEPAVIESLIVGNFEVPVTTSFPIFVDASPEEAQLGATTSVLAKQGLNFQQAWGYRLRRWVGKMQLVAFPNDANEAGFPLVHVKLGLMVRRVDPETGAALASGSNSDTMAFKNVTDPWIWQRNFFLATGNQLSASGSLETALATLSNSTFDCGSTKDGPSFDVKTARRLGPEKRTFLDVTIVGLPLGDAASLSTPGGAPTGVYFYMDYRALCSITPVAGNRRNASR